MTRFTAMFATTMMVACSGGGKDTTGPDDTGTPPACSNSISAQFPDNGNTDVYYKTDVRFTLAEEDATATIVMTDSAGAEVSGTTTVEGKIVTWSGDDFAPLTTYTATLNYACGAPSVSWTTSDVGGPTEVPIVDRVFALDLASGEWVRPAGVGDLLATQLGDTQIFVTPTETPAATITMTGAIGSQNTQDLCSPTIPFPPANWSDPYFELESDLLPLVVAGLTIEIEDMSLSGAYAPDASRIQGASLRGSIDTRPLGEAFDLGTTDDAVCGLVNTFGVQCEACSDGSGNYCLTVWVDNIEADYVPGLVIQERTQADIDADTVNCP